MPAVDVPVTLFRCLMCPSIKGEMKANGDEDWRWFRHEQGQGGPLCSETCALNFSRLSFNDQFAAAFGSIDAAVYFSYLVTSAYIDIPNVAPDQVYLIGGLKVALPDEQLLNCIGPHGANMSCPDCRTFKLTLTLCNLDVLLPDSKGSH